MQKKLSLLLLQPMLLLALASCSGGEGDVDVVTPVEPRVTDAVLPFSASVGIEKGAAFATRSTLDATWEGDELLAVSMYSTVDGEPQAPAFGTPRCYGVSPDNSVHHIGNTMLNAADTVPFSWPDESESVILRGWHYSKEYRTVVNHTFFSMPTVQDTKAKMQEYDFLFAPADTITAYTQTANLVFWHQLSMVDVYIESGKEDFVTAATDITMLSTDWVQTSQYSEPTANGQHYGTWSSFTDANNANLTTAVTPLRVDDTAGQIHVRALVMPQPTEGKPLISLSYGGKVYGYDLPDDHRPWMPGMKYAYYLRLADELTLIAVIKDFIEDGEYEGQLKEIADLPSNGDGSNTSDDEPWVQLWEGGPYWATRNIGASSETEYGDYFAWGEVEPQSEDLDNPDLGIYRYAWSTYKWMAKTWQEENDDYDNPNAINKYTIEDENMDAYRYTYDDIEGWKFIGDHKTTLEQGDDAATQNWNTNWRMPTSEELGRLLNTEYIYEDYWDNTSTTYTDGGVWVTNYKGSGVNGLLITGTQPGYTDKSIFLPAAGSYDYGSFSGEGLYGYYWSSWLSKEGSCDAYDLSFSESGKNMDRHSRYYGFSIRPVRK